MKEDNRKHIDDILAEKFRALLPEEDAPEALKAEVFRTLDFLDMFGEIADLYTAKFGAAEFGLLDLLTPNADDFPSAEQAEEE